MTNALRSGDLVLSSAASNLICMLDDHLVKYSLVPSNQEGSSLISTPLRSTSESSLSAKICSRIDSTTLLAISLSLGSYFLYLPSTGSRTGGFDHHRIDAKAVLFILEDPSATLMYLARSSRSDPEPVLSAAFSALLMRASFLSPLRSSSAARSGKASGIDWSS